MIMACLKRRAPCSWPPARFKGTAFADVPAMESFTKNGNHLIRIGMPGVDAKETDTSVAGNVLAVKD
jgi:hypothetical protein